MEFKKGQKVLVKNNPDEERRGRVFKEVALDGRYTATGPGELEEDYVYCEPIPDECNTCVYGPVGQCHCSPPQCTFIELPQATEADPTGLTPSDPGAKLDAGKPRAALLKQFGQALLEVAKVSTYGAEKYSVGGWKFVPQGFERYDDAMLRHWLKESLELDDPESNLLHAAHVAWNALARLELLLQGGADAE